MPTLATSAGSPTPRSRPLALAMLAAGIAAGCGGPAANPTTPPRGVPPATSPAAIREITFDDIKLEMQKGEPFTADRLTPRVRELDRQRVRVRGYILPSFQQSGLTQFVLVRDNQECCFGPGAALHDCVVVRMEAGRTAEFSIRPVAVEGTFHLQELRGPDGRHLAIYALDGERVQ